MRYLSPVRATQAAAERRRIALGASRADRRGCDARREWAGAEAKFHFRRQACVRHSSQVASVRRTRARYSTAYARQNSASGVDLTW